MTGEVKRLGGRLFASLALSLAMSLSVFGCADELSNQSETNGTGGAAGGAGHMGAGGTGGVAGAAGQGGESGQGGGSMEACIDPGPITMRRLNRIEYDNTIRDLLDDETGPARNFPEDDIGEGFDNVANVLTVSPLHVEKYESAAKTLAESAVLISNGSVEQIFEAEEVGSETGAVYRDDYWNLWSEGEIVVDAVFPGTGEYEIRVRAYGQQAGPDPARMSIALDGALGTTIDVEATSESPEWYSINVDATAGPHSLRVAFINDYYAPEAEDPAERDRNLIIDAIMIIGPRNAAAAVEYIFEAEEVGSDVGRAGDGFWSLWSEGSITVNFGIATAGEYDLRTRAWARQAGPDPAHMTLEVDGALVSEFDVLATGAEPVWYEERVVLGPGQHSMTVSFTNDYYMPDDPDPAQRDRNLYVDVLTVTGPHGIVEAEAGDPVPSPIMVCLPEGPDDMECARQVVQTLAHRAWRRPVTTEEVDRLMGLVQLARTERDPLEKGIQLAVRGILLSPNFLYRVELDADPADPTPHRVNDHELATRLSYFLWSTMPDEHLSERANAGDLSNPEVVAEEVERMLADPKARALVGNFASQWLFIRAMTDVAPDYNYFPDFDEALRNSMSVETRLFFERFLDENLPVADLMVAPFTFIDGRLAEHYGFDYDAAEPVDGLPVGFRELNLEDTPRGGLMTLGSILTVSSMPTRTSPVKRGKWVLEQLMCDGPPPPPPGVEAELGEVNAEASLRERLAQHRDNPQCAACHNLMDPIGLGLENFDGIGAHRTMDGSFPIDATGTLPDGTSFDGAGELGQLLQADPRFVECFHKKIFTYALGRAPEYVDRCHLHATLEETEVSEHAMADVIRAVTRSTMFTHRRGEEDAQ